MKLMKGSALNPSWPTRLLLHRPKELLVSHWLSITKKKMLTISIAFLSQLKYFDLWGGVAWLIRQKELAIGIIKRRNIGEVKCHGEGSIGRISLLLMKRIPR